MIDVVDATYSPMDWNPLYAGNPCIEALGQPQDSGFLSARLMRDPGIKAGSHLLTTPQQMHLIDQMDRNFYARTFDVEVATRVQLLLSKGYIDRNPMDPKHLCYVNNASEVAVKAFKQRGVTLFGARSYPTSLVYGPSGHGKSTGVLAALSLQPQVIQHTFYNGKNFSLCQITWLYIQAPFNGTPRGIALAFFAAVDEVLGTDYFGQYSSTKGNVEALVGAMAQIIATFGIGLLVIDEVQHVENYSGGHDQEEGLDFMIKLSNVLRVPMLFVGTYRAAAMFGSRFQNARRVCESGSIEYRLPLTYSDKEWRHSHLPRLWAYQWVAQPLMLTDAVAEWFFDLAQGVASVEVLLCNLVQQRAIRMGKSTVAKSDFIKVYNKQLGPLHPLLRALARRGHDTDAIKGYEDLVPPDGIRGLFANIKKSGPPETEPAAPVVLGSPDSTASAGAGLDDAPAMPKVEADPDDLRNVVVEQGRLETLRKKRDK